MTAAASLPDVPLPAGGKQISRYLDAGHLPQEAAAAALADNKTLLPWQAAALIEAAADAYCPSHAAQHIS